MSTMGRRKTVHFGGLEDPAAALSLETFKRIARALHPPIPVDGEPLHREAAKVIQRAGQVIARDLTAGGESLPDATPAPVNPLLAMGSLLRDHKLVGDQLKALHLDASEYHGNLQVVLSALRRMQGLVGEMLAQCEVR